MLQHIFYLESTTRVNSNIYLENLHIVLSHFSFHYDWYEICKNLSNMEVNIERNTDNTCEPLQGQLNSPASMRIKWDCGPAWIPYNSTTLGGLMWKGYIFIRSYKTDVFQKLNIQSNQFITPDGDRYPKRSKLMPSLTKMRIRQNPLYKGSGTEIGLVPMWEG